jgi:hypothetical protein
MESCSSSLKAEEGHSSNEFFGMASTAPPYHLNGRYSFLSIVKESRENLLFLELFICVIQNVYSAFVKSLGMLNIPCHNLSLAAYARAESKTQKEG